MVPRCLQLWIVIIHMGEFTLNPLCMDFIRGELLMESPACQSLTQMSHSDEPIFHKSCRCSVAISLEAHFECRSRATQTPHVASLLWDWSRPWHRKPCFARPVRGWNYSANRAEAGWRSSYENELQDKGLCDLQKWLYFLHILQDYLHQRFIRNPLNV